MTAKQIGLSVGYAFRPVKVSIIGTYQTLNQYTSYFNKRTDVPMTFINPMTGVRITRENVATETNRDFHSDKRWKLMGEIAYRLHVGKLIEIQPTIGAGFVYFGNGMYIANKYDDSIQPFEQKANPMIEGGLRFEFTSSKYQSFFIGGSYYKLFWEPDGFFESLDGPIVEKKYTGWGVNIGYNIGF